MKKSYLLVPSLLFPLLLSAFGQQPPTSQQPKPSATPDEDEVVRITTNLVQVDAVVTDRAGRQVMDLRPEDFEVIENGRPQPITNFSYVNAGPPAATPALGESAKVAPPKSVGPTPPAPSTPLRASQVRRTIALVVDDLMMSAESIRDAKRALKKYVDEQVQPGDLVAVVRTRGGAGALQQFTNDRQQLHAAIDHLHWTPGQLGGQSSIAPINNLESMMSSPAGESRGGLPASPDAERAGIREINEYREELFTVGTIGSLNLVVRALRTLPGRKAVILFSDGLSLQDSHGESRVYGGILQRLIDNANRSSVVFYTIDARGLLPLGPFASDDTKGSPLSAADGRPVNGVGGIGPSQIGQRLLSPRAGGIFEGQSGLSLLARSTGGTALVNSNDLNLGIRRALDDMRGYYLIGYRPDESSFDPVTGHLRFNTLTVRLKNHSDLRVRSRSGYVGRADESDVAATRTRGGQLLAALTSPFGAADIDLRLTSLFMNAPGAGSSLRSLLHIDPSKFTFEREADGQYRTVLDILAVTLDGDGNVFDQINRIETIRVRPENFGRFKSDGMVYDLNIPVKKPGAYQLRIAVRDAASERVGSVSQFVQIPNLRDGRLTLSGLLLSPAGATPEAGGDTAAGLAARRFHRGGVLDYGYVIYNARIDSATRRPRLVVQTRLLRDGKPVFEGQPQPFDAGQQTDLARLQASGRLQLGTQLPPGEYVLQIVVTDESAPPANARTFQWIDFSLDE